ncbi:MAG: iron ABC transporter permease [Ignavibacteriales bacterium]|nr:iron ABC transporter permease [Ignavibacteriales bacterium]
MTERRPYLTLRRSVGILSALLLLLLVVSAFSLFIGATDIGLADLWNVMTGKGTATHEIIFFQLRLPRIVLAMIVGAGLSVAGAAFQSLLRNPLAEPYILGISSGGTVGAFVAISLGLGLAPVTTPLFSFAGSGLVMFLVYTLGHRRGVLDPHALLLSGIMVGAFFNAVILVSVAVFNQELRTAYLWLLGNLSATDTGTIAVVAPVMLFASAVLVVHARSLNLIAAGDETAHQGGVDVARVRAIGYLLASLLTGLAVSVSGVIGFVGLLVPHACRLLFGSDNRIVLPASVIGGATFLVGCDILSRVVLAPSEIPVGAITAAVGAPLFVYLLKR